MFSSHPLDWALVAAYFAFLGYVWLRVPAGGGAADYLVAGRRITLPALVATLVATWYGGILGVGEYAWRHGISNWLVFGVPYYIGAVLFALAFASRARTAALYTLPDLLHRHYGRGPALMGALAVFLAAQPAAYVLVLGTLFSAMTGAALAPCVLAAAAFSILYVRRGGMRAVVKSDQVQFILMYAGMAVLVIFAVAGHGGPAWLGQRLPASHLTWNGGQPAGAILVWYFIALSALVDPGFWQRAYAARDPRVARRGVLWAVLFWILFDAMTTTAGLYARALLPDLRDPVLAFPELGRLVLPPLALGLFYVGMIATVMSTIDSYAFIAATTIARDLVWRLRGGPENGLEGLTRAGLWITCAFAAGLALMQASVIALWRDLGSIATPTLLLPVATAILGRARVGRHWTLAAMVTAFVVSLAWVFARARGGGVPPWGIEPIYAGLAISLVLYAAGWCARSLPAPLDGVPSPEGERIG